MATVKEKIEEMETPMETPDAADVSPEVTVTEETTTVSPTSRSREWMQKKYPEKAWEDDAMYDDDLVTHLEDTDARMASYAASDERIARILDLNPEFALVLDAMDKGMPFLVALRRYAGDIFESTPAEGDDDFEAYREAAEAYMAEKEKTDAEIATRNTNLEDSEKRFVTFVESQGWDEAKQDEFVKFVVDSINALGMGEVSEHFLSIMKDAFTHDEDVEDAKEAGAIEARNQKITAKRIKEAESTDGVPVGGGSSPIIEEDTYEDDSAIGGILRDYEKRRR